jgi:hypothetical protein
MRRTAVIACSALALAGSIGLALQSASASVRPTPPDSISEKGKLASDGVLTVGQPETVQVTKLQARTKLRVEVTPPLTGSCTGVKGGVCISAPITPAAGTPRFRTDGKGRATLTFTPPDHYDLLNAKNLIDRTPVPFTNGQRVIVRASGFHREIRNGNKELIFAIAQASATVVTQPTPVTTPAPTPY